MNDIRKNIDVEGFKPYEFHLNDGVKYVFHAENIYEALEIMVRVNKIHPSKIKSIIEK